MRQNVPSPEPAGRTGGPSTTMNADNLDDLNVELPEEYDGLPVFAVGGVVRDTVRGVEASDVDLMVAEVTPSEMESRGFREIDSPNNDTFAVFQDSLKREVALAREEVSTGDGHKEFRVMPVEASVEAGEAVARDLKRRDFTVNAMALDLRHDVLHDPHGGVRDLENGVLRAVDSTAFKQDPLRILRGARFAARLGADLDDATFYAMMDSVDALSSLPQERVRMEMEKALVQSDEPSNFFDTLLQVAALEKTFPELKKLIQVPAGPEEYHAEGTAFDHTMMVLDEMKELRPDDELALLMAISHDLGKGLTADEDLPGHPTHTVNGSKVVDAMAERLSLSNEQQSAMNEACQYHMMLSKVDEMRDATVIEKYQQIEYFDRLLDLTKADARGRRPRGEAQTDVAERRFSLAKQACDEWTGRRLINEGYSPDEMGGEEFGALLRQRRVEYMRELEAGEDN